MKTLSWHKAALAFVITLFITVLSPSAEAQENRPNDSTPPVTRPEEDPDAKSDGVEQDNATLRLEWQRGAWVHIVKIGDRKDVYRKGAG